MLLNCLIIRQHYSFLPFHLKKIFINLNEICSRVTGLYKKLCWFSVNIYHNNEILHVVRMVLGLLNLVKVDTRKLLAIINQRPITIIQD